VAAETATQRKADAQAAPSTQRQRHLMAERWREVPLQTFVNLFFCPASRRKSAQAQRVATPQQPPTHKRETTLVGLAAVAAAAVRRFLDF
jgi:hypothetical protein